MRNRITIWAEENEKDKVLLALELLVAENKVRIYKLPEAILTEEYVTQIETKWKSGQDQEWPEGTEILDRPLSMSQAILPDNLRVQNTKLIDQAKAEWHFQVLSSKMSEVYTLELEELKGRIEKIENYSKEAWDDLKSFWAKVQTQIQENNLMRGHARRLKKETDSLFAVLKEKRALLDQAFREKSTELANEFYQALGQIENKIKNGHALKPIFDELKKIQSNLFKTQMTKKDRYDVKSKIDAAFKAVKGKFADDPASSNSPIDRIQNRMKGLLEAIERLEKSLKRDKTDLEFQNKRIESTEGQLEAQLREAKKLMINQRITSKESKLAELNKVRKDLDKKLEREKIRQEKRRIKKEVERAKQELHQQHVQAIRKAEQERQADPKIKKAAKQIAQAKNNNKFEQIAKNIEHQISGVFEEAVQTVKTITNLIDQSLDSFIDRSEEE